MTDELNKEIGVSETDPKSVDEHRTDPPGSFMDLYRSIDVNHAATDEKFVEYAVIERVIPATVRYGIMERGLMKAYRGVVKNLEGDLFYFNYAEGAKFKLVKADDKEKIWDVERLYKSCQFGCDLVKSDTTTPLEPGEPVESDDEEEPDTAAEKASISAVAPVSEEQYAKENQSMQHEVHPGSTQSQMPDDPTKGRQWHQPQQGQPQDNPQGFAKASDGLQPLATNDGEKHWNTNDLMKAWGEKLQETAPRVAPRVSPLESQYLKEVLGATAEQIEKGMVMTPRHRLGFDQWKTTQLRGRTAGLQDWLNKQGG